MSDDEWLDSVVEEIDDEEGKTLGGGEVDAVVVVVVFGDPTPSVLFVFESPADATDATVSVGLAAVLVVVVMAVVA